MSKKASEFDQEMLQPQTTDQTTVPWGRDTEHLQPHTRTSKKTMKIKQAAFSSSASWL